MIQPLSRRVWRFLKKLKIELPYDPAIPLLGIYPRKQKTLTGKGNHIPIFITTLFTAVTTWKQHNCPTRGEGINKLWCIQTMEYYSALKRNELSDKKRHRGH